MSEQQQTLIHHRTVFDGWPAITMGVYMALVGYGVMVAIPVISTAWVNLLGFSEVQVGRVAGSDLGGFSFGAVLISRFVARYNRRHLTLACAGLAIAANALCMVMTSYEQTLVLRFIAGIGSGAFTAIAIATLAGSSKPARAFNIMLFAFAFSQGGELLVLPKLTMNQIYLFLIGTYLVSLPALRWLPPRPVDKPLDVKIDVTDRSPGGHHHIHAHVPPMIPWLVLLAVLFTYLNIGAYWTYIELASVASEADPGWVSELLVYTSFASLTGCLVATVISNRFGLARPLLVTLVVQAGIVGMLVNGIDNINVALSMFMFNFCWLLVDVYQSATIANVDHSGRFAALLPGAQGLGQILGPNLAATILALGLGYGSVFIMCASASLIGFGIYFATYMRLRTRLPALADAP